MTSAGKFIYKHNVNWSMLTEGLTLSIESHHLFAQNMGSVVKRGQVHDINLILEGRAYAAQIRNIAFDQTKYKRNEVLQIRYRKNGDLAVALQGLFKESYQYFRNERALRDEKSRAPIKLPEDSAEYLALYSTGVEDTYTMEPVLANDIYDVREILKNQPEELFESEINYCVEDPNAGINEKSGIIKVRRLNRAISENLKLLYDYKCQICGKAIGEAYNARVVESHHIDAFVSSLNNDAENQMIVCPNHHSIIHDVHPDFDRKQKLYIYQNGYREGLILNHHL